MAQRLFDDDPYLKEADASVRSCVPCDQGFAVTLDRTIFYPRGGGQGCDLGQAGAAFVLDVYPENDEIYHIVDQPLDAGETVCLKLDFARRFLHMQQHSGQHLLSSVIEKMFAKPTIISRLEEGCPHLELKDMLTDEQLLSAQEETNRLILENRKVECRYYEPDAAAKMDVRGKITPHEQIRLVAIEGYDLNACGGTHVKSTGEIGGVLITATKEVRGVFRVYFKCGSLMDEEQKSRTLALLRMQRMFGCEDVGGLEQANSECFSRRLVLEEQNRALKERQKELDAQLAIHHAEKLGDKLFFASILEEGDIKRTKAVCELAASLEDIVLLYGVIEQGSIGLLFLKSKEKGGVNLGAHLSALVKAHGGKGGGSPILAQGMMPLTEASKQAFLDTAQAVRAELLS